LEEMSDCDEECRGHCLSCCHGACPLCCQVRQCQHCILWITGEWARFWYSPACTCDKLVCRTAGIWIGTAYLAVFLTWTVTVRCLLDCILEL
jgi:hypothetical protein